ncbi:hypothetical protein ATCC90586_003515 [Pythium insidiosum]|nr:hypothetical protein ATCC90586_003515 [Pythium insidiosum]
MSTNVEFDQAYLRDTVSAPLTEAMAQLAIVQPQDPVEFLGQFLLKYVDNELRKQELAKLKQQNGGKAPGFPEYHVYGADMSSDNNAHDVKLEQLLAAERSIEGRLRDVKSVPDLFQVYLQWLATTLNAEEAYIGVRTANPAGQQLVHWVASSRGLKSSATVDKFLTEETGVTFDVFKEVEDPTGATDADGNPLPPAVPRYLHVENVLREPRMKFFHVPKLGAYLTRGLKYKSFLHADVFNESSPEEPRIKDDAWLVVSADTMGQARAFTHQEIESFQRSSAQLIQRLEELERDLYRRDAERKSTQDDVQLKEFGIAFASQVAVQEENLMLQMQSLPEDEKTLKESELRLAFLTYLLVTHAPTLAVASLRVVPFKSVTLSTFAAALTLLGHQRKAMLNPATQVPSWERIAPLVQEESLRPALEAFQATAMPPTTDAKQLLTGITKADAEAENSITASLFAWVQAAIAHAEQLEAAAERERALREQQAAEEEQ